MEVTRAERGGEKACGVNVGRSTNGWRKCRVSEVEGGEEATTHAEESVLGWSTTGVGRLEDASERVQVPIV